MFLFFFLSCQFKQLAPQNTHNTPIAPTSNSSFQHLQSMKPYSLCNILSQEKRAGFLGLRTLFTLVACCSHHFNHSHLAKLPPTPSSSLHWYVTRHPRQTTPLYTRLSKTALFRCDITTPSEKHRGSSSMLIPSTQQVVQIYLVHINPRGGKRRQSSYTF